LPDGESGIFFGNGLDRLLVICPSRCFVAPIAADLIEKIKAAIKKRAEAKAKRMFLKRPKRLAKR
jgi:hypothetical protein